MLRVSKSIQVMGSSVITVDGAEQTVMTMNASIGEDGASNINKYVQNQSLYRTNITEAKADYAAFETKVEEIIEATYYSDEEASN